MKLKVFTIFDSKCGAYEKPIFMLSKGEALRAFMEAVNTPDSTIFKYAEDFTLFEIGEYDSDNAALTALSPKIAIANALELKKTSNPISSLTTSNNGEISSIAKTS